MNCRDPTLSANQLSPVGGNGISKNLVSIDFHLSAVVLRGVSIEDVANAHKAYEESSSCLL